MKKSSNITYNYFLIRLLRRCYAFYYISKTKTCNDRPESASCALRLLNFNLYGWPFFAHTNCQQVIYYCRDCGLSGEIYKTHPFLHTVGRVNGQINACKTPRPAIKALSRSIVMYHTIVFYNIVWTLPNFWLIFWDKLLKKWVKN